MRSVQLRCTQLTSDNCKIVTWQQWPCSWTGCHSYLNKRWTLKHKKSTSAQHFHILPWKYLLHKTDRHHCLPSFCSHELYFTKSLVPICLSHQTLIIAQIRRITFKFCCNLSVTNKTINDFWLANHPLWLFVYMAQVIPGSLSSHSQWWQLWEHHENKHLSFMLLIKEVLHQLPLVIR